MIGKKALFEFFKVSPTPSLVLYIDAPRFTIADVNDAYLLATKSKSSDLIGKGIFEAFPTNDSDPTSDGVKNLAASLNTVITTHKKHQMSIQQYDIPIRGTSAFELKYWEPENIPLFNDDGELKFIIHCVRDITEKIKVKKQVKEFEYFFINSNDFSCIANTEGYFEIANSSFNKILGYSQNELATKPFIDFVHPEDIDVTLKAYDKLKSGATVIHFINRYRKKDGAYIWLDWNATPNPVTGKLYCIARDVTERKKAEETLKLLNEELEHRVKKRTEEVEKVLKENTLILESIGDAFFAVDNNWRVSYWNRIAERDLGVLKQDIVGKNLWEVFSHSIDSESYRNYHQAVNTQKLVHFEDYYAALDKWYEISAYPTENGLSVYFKDVTDKKLVEEELLKRLKEISDYKYAIDESSIVAITNQKGILTYVNANFCKISKYSSEELLGQDHRIVNSGYHPKEYIKQLWTTIANGKVWKGELKNKAKDGTPYWVDTTIVPFLNEDGKPYQYVAIRSDITERKIQEQKIKDTTQKLSDTLESIQDGFYTLDSDWNVSYWNKEAEEISGRKQVDMIGKNFWELYEGRISEKIHKAFLKAKSNNKPVRLETFSKQLNYWFEINAFPSEMGLTVYFKNITERKQTESKLKKVNRSLENHIKELDISNQELEQFAYVASHDLQEPLRMVTSFLTQIEKKYENVLDEKGKKYIFFAVDGAKRMRQIILDLLEFSRIGKNEAKHEEVDLNTIIGEIKLLYRNQIEEKKAQIYYEELPIIKNHAAPIKQVFQNLIGNSLKYSKPNQPPIIRISYSENSAAWKFEIKDNGIGINEEYFDKIFIIFQRLHSKEEYSGTGMGLSITKKIIENLRGKIWLESKEGNGTSFYFTIPKTKNQKS